MVGSHQFFYIPHTKILSFVDQMDKIESKHHHVIEGVHIYVFIKNYIFLMKLMDLYNTSVIVLCRLPIWR